jgi:hypothetical protein
MYSDIATRNFAISEKVSGQSRKQFLFWDLRSKKPIALGCNPRGKGCSPHSAGRSGKEIIFTARSTKKLENP